MKLVLSGLKTIAVQSSEDRPASEGMTRLKVRYCGICRTDAKMWHEGHRDLVFPRVLGHEVLAEDDQGQSHVVWPGRACGVCEYCTGGRENLCESMQIMGFHFDGGFSDRLLAPTRSLIQVPRSLATPRACFAEPVGCVVNALDKLGLQADERILIYGGGTVGLIAALTAQAKGARPLVIEKNAEKIAKASDFRQATGIDIRRETTHSEFDAVVNACPDEIAFCQGVAKLAKAGRLAFFSGITKNRHVETNLLNLIHYKEASVFGAYGLTRADMQQGLDLIAAHPAVFDGLIEALVPPHRAPAMFPDVLSGQGFKTVLDVAGGAPDGRRGGRAPKKKAGPRERVPKVPLSEGRLFDRICGAIAAADTKLLPAARHKIDNKTKPLGALGRLEDLAVQMSLIQQTLAPRGDHKTLFVFAADHGVTEEGVSAYPAEVTAQMVANFLNGGAAINVLCRHHGIDMHIVDMGVAADLPAHPDLIDRKIRKGTRNFALEPAMTRREAIRALEAGMDCFLDAHAHKPIHLLGLGEMGIGNTTAASAIVCAVTGIAPERATGRGTGIDDAGMRHKIEVIRKVLDFHRPAAADGLDILCKVGGFEIAGIAGAALAAASMGVAVILDGVISTAAGLIAYLIQPQIRDYLISGHRSVEAAQAAALEKMGRVPLIDLDLRLGEGTGAALAMDMVDAACRVMREMASFDEAGVAHKDG